MISCRAQTVERLETLLPDEPVGPHLLPGMQDVTELPVETLAHGQVLTAYYPPPGAHLAVIAGPKDVGRLGNSLGEEEKAQLRALDFSTHLAVVAWISGGPESLEIQRVLHHGNFVTLYATYELPITSTSVEPWFHSIALPKQGMGDQELQVTLFLQTEPLTEIPTTGPIGQLSFQTLARRKAIGEGKTVLDAILIKEPVAVVSLSEQIGVQIRAEEAAQLQALDFSERFALIAFFGSRENNLEIQKVLRRGNVVVAFVTIDVPQVGPDRQWGTTYHTIAIPRIEYEEELQTVLYLEGTSETLSLATASAGAALEAPFETVAQADQFETTGGYWDLDAPGVAIISEPSEVEQLDAVISPRAKSILRDLEYDTYFALAAFAGKQTCYFISDFRIEQVLRGETGIELYAYVRPYGQQPDCPLRLTSPYHLITLPREGLWRDGIRFTLLINDEHAVSGAYPPVVSQATPVPTPAPKVTPWLTGLPTPTPSHMHTPSPVQTPYPVP